MIYERWKPGALPDFHDGDIVNHGNFAQDILTTVTAAIHINGGNWLNVLTPNATGLKTHHITDFCYWEHLPGSVFPMNLPVEPDNCRHVTDTISFDVGAPVYIRKDTEVQ